MTAFLPLSALPALRLASETRGAVRAYYALATLTVAWVVIAFAVLARAFYLGEPSAVGLCCAVTAAGCYGLMLRAFGRMARVLREEARRGMQRAAHGFGLNLKTNN